MKKLRHCHLCILSIDFYSRLDERFSSKFLKCFILRHSPNHRRLHLLWPPYGIYRADHYIFILWFTCFYLLSSSIFFPRLISAVAEWMSNILLHMVWPQCEMQVGQVKLATRYRCLTRKASIVASVVNLVRSQVYYTERPPLFAARLPCCSASRGFVSDSRYCQCFARLLAKQHTSFKDVVERQRCILWVSCFASQYRLQKHQLDEVGNKASFYGRPVEQGRPLYFHPVVSFYLLSFFLA